MHVHALIPKATAAPLGSAWKLGNSDVIALESAEDVRRAARYITKDLPTGQGQQLRTARGHKPQPTLVELGSISALPDAIQWHFGRLPDRVFQVRRDQTFAGLSMFFDN